MTDAARSRLVRRELHSPRSTATVIVATVVILVAGWAATEIVLAAVGRPPLLVAPGQAGAFLAGLTDLPAVAVGGVGAVAVVVGVALVILALAPGRRARRVLDGSRAIVVADDVVIASSLARVAARESAVHADRVRVSVSRRTATARITPVSGSPVDTPAVQAAMQRELDRDRPQPPLRAAVRVEHRGRVGG